MKHFKLFGNPLTWGIFILFWAVLGSSCRKHPLAEYGANFEDIMRLDTGLFRGIGMGAVKAEIKAAEDENELKEEDNEDGVDYLLYEYKVKADTSLSYTVAYNFPDSSKLNSIEVDIYLQNEPQGAELFNVFKKYFDKKYGAGTTEGDFMNWNCVSRGRQVQISLADESPTYKKGKLTLDIHDLEE